LALRADHWRVTLLRRRRPETPAPDGVAADILREARIVGLRSLEQPSIGDIDRRRAEIWLLMGMVVAVFGGAAVAVSFWPSALPWLPSIVLKVAFVAMLVVAGLYSAEKERHLRQLTRLLLDERVLTTALTDRLHEIGALLEAGAAVNTAHELEPVLDIILSQAIALLGGSGGSVLRRDGDMLVVISTLGDGDSVGTRVAIGEGAAGRAARIREALLLLDRGERVGGNNAPEPGSTMAVPMIDRDELLGVVLVHAPPGRSLSEYDMRAAKLFAVSAASAISKAELLASARAQAAELEHAAFHDTLTGLANRSMFAKRVDEAICRSRTTRLATAVLYLDLDGFKGVNDRLGHTAGDLLLTAVAERLLRCLRSDAQAARLGGDEFAVLLADIEDVSVATVVARRILASINRPYSLDGREVQVTASIGVALVGPDDAEATWESLVGGADLAMYDAKRRSRGGFRVFDDALSADASIRRQLRERMDYATQNGEIGLWYQPIVDIDDGRIVAAEALIRWAHPEHGLLAPDVFLPLAVESGEIIPLGRTILRSACNQLAEWKRAHPATAPPAVSVNITARQLDIGSFFDDVRDALDAAGLPGSALILELTEDAIVSGHDAVMNTLSELRRIGVRIAIDDFGARYSALGYLVRLPVDVLKADKSLIDGLTESPETAAVVRTVIELGRRLRLDTVAEGVETQQQADILAELGCHHAQGYHFGRPMPAAQFEMLLGRGTRPLAGLVPPPRAVQASRLGA
jgi:diguanylate cyclase (GGDEF)-like protein